ncbi:hypothetical protein DO628_24970 [Salmonella enterica subsp. salamae]|uniref:Gp12 n=13 Tax=Salmonella enterica TaxID=28901 RepID=A0A0F5B4M7_SALER|nr:hypothetical protein [Salmonella enterica]EAA4085109.1 hypothetical protein [Salmonella enterica subsp. salamae serovar Sofia]EBI0478317.1 hypothetical protein [Salmonella enterica subsp. enterica serovar Braenderup]EBK2701883.1 hypothetical protein [Salmonella enterica subsp. enterica serovar Paratyphi B]EBX9237992.1 hypothetical protein [Salmonella enterica subsp. salamae serovar Springs]ECG1422964.1 hypothetical protein [Salmonella enterica subsp. salamae str. CFSAN000559]ECI2501875.1 h
MKYIYSGPASGVTLADGQEVLLWPNSEISLPEDNEWVITMIARHHLAPVVTQEAETNEEEIVHGS